MAKQSSIGLLLKLILNQSTRESANERRGLPLSSPDCENVLFAQGHTGTYLSPLTRP